MHRQNVLHSKAEASFNFGSKPILKNPYEIPVSFPERTHVRLCPGIRLTGWEVSKFSHGFRAIKKTRVADESQGDLSDEDDDLCPVECDRQTGRNPILTGGYESDLLLAWHFLKLDMRKKTCKLLEAKRK